MTFSTRKSSGISLIFYFLFLGNSQSNGQIGAPCESNVHCNQWLLQCVNFACVCSAPYVPDSTNTRCSIAIDGRCQRMDDVCHDPNASCKRIGQTVWDPTHCVCNDYFRPDPITRICHPSLGSNCTSDGVTCIAGSCVDGTCECGEGLVPDQDKKLCGIATGESCSTDSICSESKAHCSPTTNICECEEGYQSVMENGLRVCKLSLGASCETADECATTNTNCEVLRHGRTACTCAHGYVPSLTRTACLPVATHWPGICEENLQCSAMFGRYSICQTNTCSCSEGFIYVPEDFGCTAIHSAVEPRVYESIKLLATTLSPYVPAEAKLAIDEILNQLYDDDN